tara:strand:+ start:143 stop:1744 length:1602 start_codon:yes stop_codon:yes gene_type:complete
MSQAALDVDANALAPDVDAIPDFVRLGSIPVDYVQHVESDLLEPVVQQNGSTDRTGFCRFTLQNKGFLHSHSKLFVSLVPAATNTAAFLPVQVGIGAVVQRAVLKVGNQVINEISDWAQLHAVKSALISNEMNKEREQYTTGRIMNHGFRYNTGQYELANAYGLANGREYDEGDLDQMPFAKMDGTDAASIATSPTYAIDLSDLFPFLKTHQLPLYMIDQPINIEITWAPPNKARVCLNSADNPNLNYDIDPTELKFCADYIFYGASDEMQRYADANRDLSFSFVDYRANVATIDTTSPLTVVRNIGMANRMVTRVVTVFNRDSITDETMLNKYASLGLSVNTAGGADDGQVGDIAYNVRYNDRYEFASDITNTARLFSQLTDSESVPFLTRAEYAADNNLLTVNTFEGKSQQDFLNNRFFYISTRLTGGRVGTKGIELHLNATDFRTLDAAATVITGLVVGKTYEITSIGDSDFTLATGASANVVGTIFKAAAVGVGTGTATGVAGPTSMRSYSEYLRIARLRDGQMDISNA